jgi:Fungal specific transcription factor domain
MVSLRFS